MFVDLVDILKSIAEACRIAQNKKQLSDEQQKNLVSRVVGKVVGNYKETQGSLKAFNKAGKDVTHIEVTDDETAQILKKACKKWFSYLLAK